MYNNIVVTGANSPYYESLLTLISSIHKHSFDLVDMIFVYDFGLSNEEIKTLEKLKKVQVRSLNELTESHKELCNSFSSIKTRCHFFKMFTLFDSTNLGNKIIWIDAGAMCLRSLNDIYNEIEFNDIFLVSDIHLNKNYTHDLCKTIMNANEEELSDNQLWSGLVGFKSGGKYQSIINEGWEYSKTQGCIDGFEQNHRHDQSVLSILSSRYKCPTQNIDIFGYWTDVNRNLEKAIEIGSVIFVHRRGHIDKKNLLYEN